MEKSVLWQSFQVLSNLERKHLGQWLESPFFCRREEPVSLFVYLQTCLLQSRAPVLEEALQETGAADVKTIRLVMSELLQQIEHFLVYQEKFSASYDFHTQLAAAYRRRGLEKHFHRALQRARQELESQPFRHSEYYQARAEVEYELYQQISSAQRTEALNLQELVNAADTAFMTAKLRQACFALTHQAVYNADYDMGLLPAVLSYLEQRPALLGLPAVALYYHCFLFLTEPDAEVHFTRFKALLFTHADTLPPDELRNLHLLAINYCVRKINQLNDAYFREAFDLYRSALEADLLLENGVLSPFAYNNIVAIALRVQESSWAEAFVQRYSVYLEKKVREANYRLNLARIAYHHKAYGQALLHLQESDYKDLINNLIAKTLQLKIYFETGEFDALDAHLQSMKSFLRRHRVIGYHRDNYRNIIKFTRRLMQHPFKGRSELESLRKLIRETSPLTEKEWLLEMAS